MKCATPYWIVPKHHEGQINSYHEYTNGVIPDEAIMVPCGYCEVCRRARADQWATRLKHELESWTQYCFLTLTYDDEHVPRGHLPFGVEFLSLYRKDVSDFLVAFRRYFRGRKVKYFFVGEYGIRTLRPHYHGILFGYRPDASELVRLGQYWTTDLLLSLWSRGAIQVGSVSEQSIRYVSGYILKAWIGKRDEGDPREVERVICSKGIGLDWCLKHQDELESLPDEMYGERFTLPRYYKKKIDYDTGKAELLRARAERDVLSVLADEGVDTYEEAMKRIQKSRDAGLADAVAKARISQSRKLL